MRKPKHPSFGEVAFSMCIHTASAKPQELRCISVGDLNTTPSSGFMNVSRHSLEKHNARTSAFPQDGNTRVSKGIASFE